MVTSDPIQARLDEAFTLLEKTPTGADLLAQARTNGVRWKLDPDDEWMLYHQSENQVVVGRSFVQRYQPAQLAYMFAHELEHARQSVLMGGAPGGNALELELGGLSAQSRVWVEMGAPIDAAAWSAGRAWLKDHALWLSHPEAAYYSWRLRRSSVRENEASAPVRAYWERLAMEDAEWRKSWSGRFPALSPERTQEAFRTVMDASLGAALGDREAVGSGEYSRWMPDMLQALPGLRVGQDFALFSLPGPKDLRLLAYLEHEVAVYQLDDGRWFLRKGEERTVPLGDRKGHLSVLYHNHPAHIQDDPLGRAPSSRDFFDDEAPVMSLITRAGLTRYKMPARLKDPRTGELFDPRALTYGQFRNRIYGEEGPPYMGELAAESVRDPVAFYRRLGMEIGTASFPRAGGG